jgi:hypothetical protein
MKQLLTAIQTKWNATTTITSVVTGGLTLDSSPSTSLPYAVLTPISSPLEDGYSGTPHSIERVQLMVIGRGAATVGGYMDVVTAAFDETALTLGSGTNFWMERLTSPRPIQCPKDDFGEDVWAWVVEYSYAIQ